MLHHTLLSTPAAPYFKPPGSSVSAPLSDVRTYVVLDGGGDHFFEAAEAVGVVLEEGVGGFLATQHVPRQPSRRPSNPAVTCLIVASSCTSSSATSFPTCNSDRPTD